MTFTRQFAMLVLVVASIASVTSRAADLKQLKSIEPNGAAKQFEDVSFSPDGKWLACLASDYSIQLYDVKTFEFVRKIDGLKKLCQCMQFSHDGSKLMAVPLGEGEPLNVWNVADGKLLHQIKVKSNDWLTVAAMPHSDEVAIIFTNPRLTVGVWSLATGKALRQAELTGSIAQNIKVSGNGKWLAVSQEELTILVDATNLKTVKNLEESPSVYDYSPDGKTFAMAFGSEIHFQLLGSDEIRKIALPASRKSILEMDYTPDGKTIVLSRTDFRAVKLVTEILLVDIAGKGVVGKLEHQSDDQISNCAISPDGARLATTITEGKSVSIWDISPWSKPAPVIASESDFRTWSSADGKFQVVAKLLKSNDKFVTLQRKDNNATVTVPIAVLSEADQSHLKAKQ